MIQKGRILTISLAISAIYLAFIGATNSVSAANCGGAIVCACGDTVVASTTLTGDLGPCTGNGLVVGANNITIDGGEHLIIGNGAGRFSGIDNSSGYSSITIKNFSNITAFVNGIHLLNCSSSTIQSVVANSNSRYGISLDHSSYNTLNNNTTNLNGDSGIYLEYSPHNTLVNNVMSENKVNFKTFSDAAEDYDNTIDTTNTVEGMPILYLYDTHGTSDIHKIYSGAAIDTGKGYDYVGDIGMFWCISCSYVDLKNAILSPRNYVGAYFVNTSSSTIQNVVSDSNSHAGIQLENSSYNTLNNNTANLNYNFGINIASSSYNTLNNNTANSNAITHTANSAFSAGIRLDTSSFNTLTDNVTSLNASNGISLVLSSDNTLDGNTASSNVWTGVSLGFASSNNALVGNNVLNNIVDIYEEAGPNNFSLNKFSHNIDSKMLTFTDVPRTKQINETIILDTLMFNANGQACPTCTYVVTTSPSETVATTRTNNNLVSSFTATRPGAYSLSYIITDPNNNITKRNFSFFINATGLKTTMFYFRGAEPAHGQPNGSGFLDSGSLLLTAPMSSETRNCGVWIQNSIDEMPSYPLANLSSIDTYSWYKQNMENGSFIGINRDYSYSVAVDFSQPVPPALDYTWVNKTFSNVNWAMDYPRSWYTPTIKLWGTNTYWTSFPEGQANKSHADLTYEYTTTPAIRAISNISINVLSATTPVNATSSAQIVLENPLAEATSTILTLDDFRRPFLNAISTIYSDATTTLSTSLNSEASSTLDAVALDLTPSAGSVTININTWNTDGNYYKKWTEEGSGHDISTEHTIGDLKPNTVYNIKVDSGTYETLTSNSYGEISFIYSGGYSVKTFEVEEKIFPTGGTLPVSPPATGGGGYTVNIPMDQAQDIGLIETTGVNTLSYIGSISSFNALVGRTYTIEKHKIKIIGLDLYNNIITLQVESEPQILNIKLTELEKVDLDNDKSPDISIQFSSLFVNRAELTIKSLINQIPAETSPEINTITPITPTTTISPSAPQPKYNFKRSLRQGMSGADVRDLQKYLNANGYLISKSGVGSKGKETNYFGAATRTALIKYQKAKKITPASGLFGPLTRAIVNK